MNANAPEHIMAHALLSSMDRTTPGGIDRRRIMPVSLWRHWLTILAWTAFGIGMLFVAAAWVTH